MADRYANFAQSRLGRTAVRRLGLPDPPQLRRYQAGDPVAAGPVLLGAAPGGRLSEAIGKNLTGAGVEIAAPAAERDDRRLFAALIFDATGITDPAGLTALYDFFHPYARSLYPNGRVIVCGTPPEAAGEAAATAAQQALEGFLRSVGKEFGRGTTAQLLQVAPGAEGNLESTLRFLLSTRSAYVSGQVIGIGPAPVATPTDWQRSLSGRIAVVTGAARGIGAAMAEVLARDGAEVVCVDRADSGDALARLANEVGGTALQLDLSAAEAPTRLVQHLAGRHGRVDILVHNAGITRDRTLAKMDGDGWRSVLDVNLVTPTRINEAVLASELMGEGGRLIGVSSVSGIGGNRGQTNYAASKAGVIGLVRALAKELGERRITSNAVAPGFIETRMTAAMPAVPREVGRRLNSLAQGGLPVDVAETVSWLASPASSGVTGQVVRVCGQSWLGA